MKIFTWNVHGTFMNALAKTGHDFYVPIKRGRPYNYDGRTPGYIWPHTIHQISVSEIKKIKYDLIIFQTPQQVFEEQYKVLSESQRNLPKIYIVHSTFRRDPRKRRRKDIKKLVKYLMEEVIPAMDAIVHVTKYNLKQWTTYFPQTKSKSLAIYNGIEIPKNVKWVGDNPHAVNVTVSLPTRPECGREIWLKVKEKAPLMLYGTDSEKFGGKGIIQNKDLRKEIAQYRLYFNPTAVSSMPMAMLEAMSIGLPVVSTKTMELPNIIKNGVNGFISNNPNVLASKINLLLKDKKLAEKLGRAAQKTIRNKFSMKRFVRQWNDLINKTAAKSK
ncbi:MAG: glycosyltransferase family 4 protein [Minisyncoccia bacterium]